MMEVISNHNWLTIFTASRKVRAITTLTVTNSFRYCPNISTRWRSMEPISWVYLASSSNNKVRSSISGISTRGTLAAANKLFMSPLKPCQTARQRFTDLYARPGRTITPYRVSHVLWIVSVFYILNMHGMTAVISCCTSYQKRTLTQSNISRYLKGRMSLRAMHPVRENDALGFVKSAKARRRSTRWSLCANCSSNIIGGSRDGDHFPFVVRSVSAERV